MLAARNKKIGSHVPDKKERTDLAYGNVPTTDFEAANEAVDKLSRLTKNSWKQFRMVLQKELLNYR